MAKRHRTGPGQEDHGTVVRGPLYTWRQNLEAWRNYLEAIVALVHPKYPA
jgi:hypothetical protein